MPPALDEEETLFFVTAWFDRQDLQKAFPEVGALQMERFEKWAMSYGRGEYPEPRDISKFSADARTRAVSLLHVDSGTEQFAGQASEQEIGDRPLIYGFLQVYNEVIKGNLRRCLANLKKYTDGIVAYDDGSYDGSYEVLKEFMPKENILRGEKNDWEGELTHKQALLEMLIKDHQPIWAYWLDADEVTDAPGTVGMRAFAKAALESNHDSYRFRELQLWLSSSWARTDQGFDEGSFIRLWRVRPGLRFSIARGTHHAQFPMGMTAIGNAPFNVLHYGNASKSWIRYKAMQYTGGRGKIGRHLDNIHATYIPVPKALVPDGAEWTETPIPKKLPPLYRARVEKITGAEGDPLERVVVILPAHGERAAMLKSAVRSVVDQTHENWELYILGDGLSGRTAEVAREAAEEDPRVHYAEYPLLKTGNRGGVAMNEIGCAIAVERGAFWTRLGSDDVFLPEKITRDVTFLKAHKEFGACYGPYVDMDEDGDTKDGIKNPEIEPSEIEERLRKSFVVSWANVCARTPFLATVREKFGSFCDPRLVNMEDWNLNSRLSTLARFGWTGPEPAARYRVWKGQSSEGPIYAKDSKTMQKILAEAKGA